MALTGRANLCALLNVKYSGKCPSLLLMQQL